MIATIFFDAAGTLFETREPVGLTYARIAREHGLSASDEVVTSGFRRAFASAPGLAFGPGHQAAGLRELERRWWREVVNRSFAEVGGFEDFEVFFDALFAYFADPAHWEAVPEARTVLAKLRSLGLKLGVISNFDYRIYRILEELELAESFDSVTISSEAGYAKPNREIFECALSKHRNSASEAIHVGDSEAVDFKGAGAAGLTPVLIDRKFGASCATIDMGYKIGSLAILIGVTQRLNSA